MENVGRNVFEDKPCDIKGVARTAGWSCRDFGVKNGGEHFGERRIGRFP
jgi:hypothetical protein